MYIILLIIIWILCGIIAAMLGKKKEKAVAGFLWGATLGPLGILIADFSREKKRRCPFCHKKIKIRATACRYCKNSMPEGPPASRLTFWLILIALIVSGAVGYVVVSYFNEAKPKAQKPPVVMEKGCETQFEVLNKEYFREGAKIDIQVPPHTPKAKVLELAHCLDQKHADYNMFNLRIYDDLETYNNRDNENFPEKISSQHFLCLMTVNRSSKYNQLHWLAQNRQEPND